MHHQISITESLSVGRSINPSVGPSVTLSYKQPWKIDVFKLMNYGLNCYYLVDVPMSLVGFSKESGNVGFVIVRLKKLGINARTISVMCIIDHAA